MRRDVRRLFPMMMTIALAAAASGCGSDGVTDPSAVQGVTWRLVRLEPQGEPAVTVASPDRYTLAFNEDKRLGVRSDCNQCGGTYELKDGDFTVGPLACTKAFCGEQSLDSDYSSILSEAHTLETNDGALIVRSSRGTLRFTP